MAFKKAKRKPIPMTIAIAGASGSGKTLSALKMARGLAGPEGEIFFIDTEMGRGEYYADDPEIGGYMYDQLMPPYTPQRLQAMIEEATLAGADAIVVDSMSHIWEGQGGVLDAADAEEERLVAAGARRASVSMQKWIKPKRPYNQLITYATASPVHVIFCLRTALKSVMVNKVDRNGKIILNRSGKPMQEVEEQWLPVCEKNFMFQMTVGLHIQPDHTITAIKIPEFHKAALRPGEIITVQTGVKMREIESGFTLDKKASQEILVRLSAMADECTDQQMLVSIWQEHLQEIGNMTGPDKLRLQEHMRSLRGSLPEHEPGHENEPVRNEQHRRVSNPDYGARQSGGHVPGLAKAANPLDV